MKYAPVILFVYNRPEHTRQTLEALKKNQLAPYTRLIVYSDGALDEINQPKVQEVRNLFSDIKVFEDLQVIERERNFGLADNIISGVTEVLNQTGRVIVLEDDLITSPYFLQFMNDALNVYEDELKVSHIQAYCYDIPDLPETFLTQWIGSWGWATWKPAWDTFETDGKVLLEKLRYGNGLSRGFDFNAKYMRMLKNQTEGRNNSWAIRWYASCYLQGMLALNSGRSLILNTGFDGTGTNCEVSDRFESELHNHPVHVKKITPVEKNRKVHQKILRFNSKKNSITVRLKTVIQNYRFYLNQKWFV